jgi:hypothetical protein
MCRCGGCRRQGTERVSLRSLQNPLTRVVLPATPLGSVEYLAKFPDDRLPDDLPIDPAQAEQLRAFVEKTVKTRAVERERILEDQRTYKELAALAAENDPQLVRAALQPPALENFVEEEEVPSHKALFEPVEDNDVSFEDAEADIYGTKDSDDVPEDDVPEDGVPKDDVAKVVAKDVAKDDVDSAVKSPEMDSEAAENSWLSEAGTVSAEEKKALEESLKLARNFPRLYAPTVFDMNNVPPGFQLLEDTMNLQDLSSEDELGPLQIEDLLPPSLEVDRIPDPNDDMNDPAVKESLEAVQKALAAGEEPKLDWLTLGEEDEDVDVEKGVDKDVDKSEEVDEGEKVGQNVHEDEVEDEVVDEDEFVDEDEVVDVDEDVDEEVDVDEDVEPLLPRELVYELNDPEAVVELDETVDELELELENLEEVLSGEDSDATASGSGSSSGVSSGSSSDEAGDVAAPINKGADGRA